MKTNESAGLSVAELRTLRAALLAGREELLGHPHPSKSQESSAPEVGDAMDRADHVSEVEEAGARTERDRTRRAEIDHALAKLDRGEYGVSEDSGEPIGIGRLRVLPWARLTVKEEEALEKRR